MALGTQLINVLEQIHQAGYVYNDLKPDNIMIKVPENSSMSDISFLKHEVNLIDFGFATKYLDKETGLHIEKKDVAMFRGNFTFASLNQLKYKTTSRRDDLIQLFYFLVYLLHGNSLFGIETDAKSDKQAELARIRKIKAGIKSKDLCVGDSSCLQNLKKEIFCYHFKDEPRYDLLREILIDQIE